MSIHHIILASMLAVSTNSHAFDITAVTENLAPYNYKENNVVKGSSTEIVRTVLDKAGAKYTIDVLPWARAYSQALHNKNVLIYTIMRNDTREPLFKWIRPVANTSYNVLYRLKSNPSIAPKSIEDAKKYRVVVVNEFIDQSVLTSMKFPNIVAAPSVQSAIDMFFAKRTDLFSFESESLGAELSKAGYSMNEVVAVLPIYHSQPYMALSNSTDDGIVQQLQDAYDSLKKDRKIPEFKN